MALAAASLDERYERESGAVYLTGTQALVRLVLMQRARDRRAGLDNRVLHLRLPRLAVAQRRQGAVARATLPRPRRRATSSRR